MTEEDLSKKTEFNIKEFQDKLARAVSCKDWNDMLNNSSNGFIEEARKHVAEKYFKYDSECDVIFIDNRPYYNNSGQAKLMSI